MNRIRFIRSTPTAAFLTSFLIFGMALCIAAPSSRAAQPTRADAEKDPVFKAMLAEMDRSMSELQLKDFAKPFFIQYRIEDVDNFETKAEYGATEGRQHTHERVARIIVRVGDYKEDSSGGRGDGALQLSSLNDDPVAIRSVLWAATDQAYKAALAAYAQKQAALKQVQTPPQADDFSKEKPIVFLTEPMKFELDETAWEDRVARASGLYRTDPKVKDSQHDIEYSVASFSGRVVNTWLVNSEGTIVRKASALYQESFAVGAQAADGMRLERSRGATAVSLKDLEPQAVFEKKAVEEIASLADLRKAPLVEEEYHGPVLLSSDAGTDTLRALLEGGVVAYRPKLGTEARTTGPFASSYHARVLPDQMDVVDDPGLKTFDGEALVGAYDVDDEGVPAQAVHLVENGKLQNYLIGREPVRDFPLSNGHGRAGIAGPAHPSIGVLKITAKDGISDDELFKKLIEMAKDRDLKSVYYVETLGGASTPRLLYRVGTDGKRELVRGAVLDDLDQRALRSGIEAAGKNLFVANSDGEIPTTVLGPALLMDDVTVKRANETNDKLPFYPAP
jgi:predicted Zn-dependent protease